MINLQHFMGCLHSVSPRFPSIRRTVSFFPRNFPWDLDGSLAKLTQVSLQAPGFILAIDIHQSSHGMVEKLEEWRMIDARLWTR